MSNNQPCKYCGIKIIRWEKLPDGKYLRYDENGLHKYDICKAEQLKRHKTSSSYQPNHQAPQGRVTTTHQTGPLSNYVGGTSTFPVDKEPEIRGVTINSLFVKTSNMEKEIKELRKQIETLASIADSIAQKTELIVAKVGYPAPEVPKPAVELSQERARREIEEAKPVKEYVCNICGNSFVIGVLNDREKICNDCFKRGKDLTPERQKAYEENSKKFDETMAQIEKRTTDESGVLLKDGQEIKAVTVNKDKDLEAMKERETFYKSLEAQPQQRSLSPDEVNRTREDGAMQFLNKSDVMQWQNISEAFLCHNCEGKFHNGFMKLGTKLCEGCKKGIEANESEDTSDRSDVNSFTPDSQHLRSIEDINSDEDVSF